MLVRNVLADVSRQRAFICNQDGFSDESNDVTHLYNLSVQKLLIKQIKAIDEHIC